ncbi:MAG: CapA family protein [Clostridia bacterium]|nr:CapA family protein [Clostridia bacterium]
MAKRLLVLLICLLLCSGCRDGYWQHQQIMPGLSAESDQQGCTAIPIEDAPLDTITFSFVGDVMLASEYSAGRYGTFNTFAETADPGYFFEKMLPVFASDDWTVANCENVFADQIEEMAVKDYSPAYWYRSDTKYAGIYPQSSIEVASLANNHALDFGWRGYTDTENALKAEKVITVGEKQSVVLEKNGVRIGLFCCSLYSNHHLTPILDWLALAAEKTDFQIVYYHGGAERVHEPEDWRIAACHAMVDAGADLVLGSHPHVLQPYEVYNGGEIVYSLGNFLFGGSRTCENATIVFRLVIETTDGKISNTYSEMIPCYCYGELWQPLVMESDEDRQAVLDFMYGKRESPC